MTTRLALSAAAFTVIVGGVLAWYAFFKAPDPVVPVSLAITAYVDPAAAAKRGCVRRLTLVVTVRNTGPEPATIAAVRFLAGTRTSLDAGVSSRRVGGEKQVALRFDVAPIYARLRSQRIARSIARVEVRDGAGIRYRRPVGLNSDVRICAE